MSEAHALAALWEHWADLGAEADRREEVARQVELDEFRDAANAWLWQGLEEEG